MEAFDVSFPPTGLTVIQGPNEVGKSSLAEAVDLLLDCAHDSRHRRVLAVRPVHLSGGTEVEVEFTTGKYHLRYRKRWFHNPATWLTILAPTQESLVAREAHDRVVAILEETLDRALYRALRFVQGEKVQQGDVSTATTLTDALDRAASRGGVDSKVESSLWKAVQVERGRYFTEGGKSNQERQRVANDVAAATRQLDATSHSLSDLEGTGEALRETAERLRGLILQASEAEEQLGGVKSERDQLESLARRIEISRAQLTAAELREKAASAAWEERQATVSAIEDRGRRIEQRESALSQSTPELEQLEEREAAAKLELDAAEEANGSASSFQVSAEADLTFRRAELDLRLLGNRLERVQHADATEKAARRVLEACKVTPKARGQVQAALDAVTSARVATEVACPTLDLTALRDQDFELDGESAHLAKGERRRASVEADTVLVLSGVMSLRVIPGRSTRELSKAAADAERLLLELRDHLGLQSPDPLAEVNAALEAARDADRDVKNATKTRTDALEDLTEQQLAAKVESARLLVSSYPEQRGSKWPLPATFEEAESVYNAAKASLRKTQEAADNARTVWSGLQDGLKAAQVAARTELGQIRNDREQLDAERAKLQEARANRPDTDLESGASKTSGVARDAQIDLQKLEVEYQALDPDGVKLRLDDAQRLADRLASERLEAGQRETQLKTTLEVQGASDVRESVERLERDLVLKQAQQSDLERRAQAAELLYKTFSRHREQVRLAYVEPYQAEIEKLARLLFGPKTTVQIDPGDLSILSRTMNGVTVPFDSLSTGTREQLAVIARLACAILVNPTGDQADAGAPILLDDALGYSDPSKLRRLGPAFTRAAQMAQVIVMTCSPDRYGSIGAATVVPMGNPSPQASNLGS